MKFLEHIDLRYKMTTAIGYSLFEMQVNLNVIKELDHVVHGSEIHCTLGIIKSHIVSVK